MSSEQKDTIIFFEVKQNKNPVYGTPPYTISKTNNVSVIPGSTLMITFTSVLYDNKMVWVARYI
jgi:hypothetical protein